MSGVIPQVAALMGPCAAGTAYIPGLADFVPMVKGRGSMALAGPAPGARGDRRGRHPGGARRLARALPQVGRRRHGGGRRRGVHRAHQAVPVVHAAELRSSRRRVRAPSDPIDRREEALLDVLPESNRKPYDMYEVIRRIVDDGELFDMKAPVGEDDHHLLRPLRRPPRGDRRQPAQAAGRDPRQRLRRQGRPLREPVQRVRDPAGVHAGRARLHGRHEGRGRRHHPPRREDALRGRQRDRAEGHGDHAQGLRRRLLRDERARLRARPDRRLAERRDQRDGRRGRGGDRVSQTGRRSRRPGRPRRPS